MARKILITLFVFVALFAVSAWVVSQTHPILLKWLAGTARLIGKPRDADVYTDAHLNKAVHIYHVNKHWDGAKTDYYILYPVTDKAVKLNYALMLNIPEDYAVIPNGSTMRDYDFVFGQLFQSEAGAHFDEFFTIKPILSYNRTQINIRTVHDNKMVNYDSLSIVFRK